VRNILKCTYHVIVQSLDTYRMFTDGLYVGNKRIPGIDNYCAGAVPDATDLIAYINTPLARAT